MSHGSPWPGLVSGLGTAGAGVMSWGLDEPHCVAGRLTASVSMTTVYVAKMEKRGLMGGTRTYN